MTARIVRMVVLALAAMGLWALIVGAVAGAWQGRAALILGLLAIGTVLVVRIRKALMPLDPVLDALRAAAPMAMGTMAGAENAGQDSAGLANAVKALARAAAERDEALRELARTEETRSLTQEMALRFEKELETERQSLARGLLDELGQQTTSIRAMAQTVERRLTASDPSLAQLVRLLVRNTDGMLGAIRAMIRRVRPEAFERGGLLEGVRSMIDDLRLEQPGRRFELLAEPSDAAEFGFGSPDLEGMAHQAIQLAIASAVRERDAKTVIVSLVVENDELSVLVHDDGLRRPGERRVSASKALDEIGPRAQAAGGRLEKRPGDSGGNELVMRLPWPGA